MAAPIIVMKASQERENGRKVQLGNIAAAKAVGDIVRTCLGPQAMLKMLLDPQGGIVLTNDGNCVLREIQVQHPAARSIIEISRTQDEEVGDGTTTVVILAGEIMSLSECLISQSIHPLHIINGLRAALEDAVEYSKQISAPLEINDIARVKDVIKCTLGTKVNREWSDMICDLAWRAVNIVAVSKNGRLEIDFKRYARVEKIFGGDIRESSLIEGVVLNKDVVHTGMRRYIESPRIILLDCTLEYKKGESQTSYEFTKPEDFDRAMKIEEESVKKMCSDIIALKADLVITEKGCSDIAQYYLHKAGISVLRRVKKSDSIRISRATGAQIVNQTEDLTPEAVGTRCGVFRVDKIGDEYYSYLLNCKDTKACTILLRGASKDIVNEVERNLIDALSVARNLKFEPSTVPGGGAFEMALSIELEARSKRAAPLIQAAYVIASRALEVIPRTLIQNAGQNPMKILTQLKAKQMAEKSTSFGIEGVSGKVENMVDLKIVDCTAVKTQTLKVAFEACMVLLKIDDIVSGTRKTSDTEKPKSSAPITQESQME